MLPALAGCCGALDCPRFSSRTGALCAAVSLYVRYFGWPENLLIGRIMTAVLCFSRASLPCAAILTLPRR